MPIARTSRGPIEYHLSGAGPVVMVLKGGHSSRDTKLGHERLVDEGFAVLEPSHPGYDSTPQSVGRSAQQAADALAELLGILEIPSASLVAISAAGHTGIELARPVVAAVGESYGGEKRLSSLAGGAAGDACEVGRDLDVLEGVEGR